MTSYKELSEKFGVSPDTVRKQLDTIAQIQGDDSTLRTRKGRQWQVTPFGISQLEIFREMGVEGYRDSWGGFQNCITPEVLPPDRQSTALTVSVNKLATRSKSQVFHVEDLLESAIQSIQVDLEEGQSIEQLLQQARRQKLANEAAIQAIEDFQATRGHYQATIEKLKLVELGVLSTQEQS